MIGPCNILTNIFGGIPTETDKYFLAWIPIILLEQSGYSVATYSRLRFLQALLCTCRCLFHLFLFATKCLVENNVDVPVLKPDLNNPHVQSGIGRKLFSDMSGRFGTARIRCLQFIQLTGIDGCAWSLAAQVFFCGIASSISYRRCI